MKNEFYDLSKSQITLQSQKMLSVNEYKIIYCPSNYISTQICQNKKCKNNAFICDQKECQCQKKHSKCFTLNLKKFLKTIEQKTISISFIENCIDIKFQQLIDLISKFHDQMKNWIHDQFQYLGLNENQKSFLNDVRRNNFQATTGQKIWQIIHPQQQQLPLNQFIAENIQTLSNYFENTKTNLNKNLTLIKKQIQTYEEKIFQGNGTITNIICSKQKSKILTEIKETKILNQFFIPRKIKSAKLLYRASQNDFDVKKFHEKCDGLSNTLTLVQNEFGKKIGGYTPIKWSSVNSWVNDESMTSFVFSITNGDKFPPANKERNIWFHSNYGPSFGGGQDLCIYDKANRNNSSFANINHTYKNDQYQYNDRKTWQKYCGNSQSFNFKIKQWQVWSLEFV